MVPFVKMPRSHATLVKKVFRDTGLTSGCPCAQITRGNIEQRLRSHLHGMRLRRVDDRFLRQTLREFKMVLQAQKAGTHPGNPRSILAVDLAECLGLYDARLAAKKTECAQYNFIARLILWFNLRVQRMRPDVSQETIDLSNFLISQK